MNSDQLIIGFDGSENVIASAIDDNYVLPLLVMLESSISNASSKFRFILGYDPFCLSKENRSLVKKFCEINNLQIDLVEVKLDLKLEFDNYITSTTYARLILADLMPVKFLWIDADVICLPGWDYFFIIGNSVIENKLIVGVKDPLVRTGVPESSRGNMALTVSGEKYINAGVVLLNPILWREMRAPELWREAFANYLQLGFEFNDQCILNYVAGDSRHLIAEEFNYLVRNSDGRKIENPQIIHFAGGFKPWHMPEFALRLLSPKPHRDLYQNYASLQLRTVTSLMKFDLQLGIQLWRQRLKLRQTDTLFKIVIQKFKWWAQRRRIHILRLFRKSILFILKLPVIRSLWQNHLNSINEIQKNKIIEIEFGFLQEIENLKMKLSEYNLPEVSKLEDKSFGKVEVYYSSPNSLLVKLFDQYGSDKGTLGKPVLNFPWRSHNYSDIYSNTFEKVRFQITRVFECGIGTNNTQIQSSMTKNGIPGASLRAWRDYFPNAIVFGADIDREILFQENRIHTGYLDQLDTKSIKEYWENVDEPCFDLMIDDGLHTFEASKNLFLNSIQFLNEGGYYIIEDVHYADLLLYQSFFSEADYNFKFFLIKRHNHVLGDNILIEIRNK